MLGEVTVLVCAEEAAFDDYHVHSKREEDVSYFNASTCLTARA